MKYYILSTVQIDSNFLTFLGLSRFGSGSLLMDDTGILLLGAIAPGIEMFRGYLQDVRIFTQSLDDT